MYSNAEDLFKFGQYMYFCWPFMYDEVDVTEKVEVARGNSAQLL